MRKFTKKQVAELTALRVALRNASKLLDEVYAVRQAEHATLTAGKDKPYEFMNANIYQHPDYKAASDVVKAADIALRKRVQELKGGPAFTTAKYQNPSEVKYFRLSGAGNELYAVVKHLSRGMVVKRVGKFFADERGLAKPASRAKEFIVVWEEQIDYRSKDFRRYYNYFNLATGWDYLPVQENNS